VRDPFQVELKRRKLRAEIRIVGFCIVSIERRFTRSDGKEIEPSLAHAVFYLGFFEKCNPVPSVF
jgi:hypothetical protein